MQWVQPVISVVVIAAVIWVGWKFLWPLFLPEDKELDVQTTVVMRNDLRRVVPADGVVTPVVEVEVKSKASGLVELVAVEEGDHVEVGDIIVELDKAQIMARKRQAEASLMSAQVRLSQIQRDLTKQQQASQESSIRRAEISLEEARSRYERIKELYAKAFATDEELDNAAYAVENAQEALDQAKLQYELDLEGGEPEDIAVAETQVEIAQAELDDVIEELANTTIRAPQAGTVLSCPVEIGTAVASATSGNSAGTLVAVIGDLSEMYVSAYIEETNLGSVKVDIPCRISFDAYVGWMWPGLVSKLYPQGEQSGNSTRFRVDININLEGAVLEEAGGMGGFSPEMMAGGMRGGAMPGGMAGGMRGGGMRGGSMRGGGGMSPGGGQPGGGGPGQESPEGGAEQKLKPEVPSLYPQMTANVDIVLEDHPGVLILPAQYVKYEEGKPVCYVLPDPDNQENKERRDLELGFSDGTRYEVASGLEEGETVILERPISQNNNRRR